MLSLEILLVLVLVLINGVLAMSELAVVSSRPGRLRAMIERGVPGARTALALATEPSRFLSTVQVGITLVGILAGAFSGASLGRYLSWYLAGLGLDADIAAALGLGLVVAAITYVSLVAGELVPKQIALQNPEAIACRIAVPMRWLSRLAAPFVWLLDHSGRLLIRLMGRTTPPESSVSDEEIRLLISEAESAGVIESGERHMIAGVMRLGDRPVRAVMTALTAVDMLDASDDPPSLRRKIAASPHSRIPVYDGSPEEVVGVLQVKDVADRLLARKAFDIRKLVRKVPVIHESMPAIDAIELFRGSAIHMAFVQDEYGRTLGIVTAADLLAAIAGSAVVGGEDAEPRAVQRDDGSWLLSGDLAVDEMAELIGFKLPARRRYETVAGLLLDTLKHLPGPGASARVGDWRFEVLDLDGRRIDKVLASRNTNTHRPLNRPPGQVP